MQTAYISIGGCMIEIVLEKGPDKCKTPCPYSTNRLLHMYVYIHTYCRNWFPSLGECVKNKVESRCE